jgi:hypothetical protein
MSRCSGAAGPGVGSSYPATAGQGVARRNDDDEGGAMSTKETEKGLFLVFSNAASPARVEAFNRWYDEVHLREVLSVPGVVAATRYELDEDQMMPGEDGFGRRFLAVYEIEAEDLKQVRDAVRATSSQRSHSETLELEPLPAMAIFRQISSRIED